MARLETIDEHEEGDIKVGHATPSQPVTEKPCGRKRKKRTGWLRFASSVVLAVFGVPLFVLAVFGVLYLVLDRKMPLYTVDAINMTAFGMDDDLTATARFEATVWFENPNHAIGISYEEGSNLAPMYGGYQLSESTLPAWISLRQIGFAQLIAALVGSSSHGYSVFSVFVV